MNLVFFGGSFDPPHRGHLEIIRYCQQHFNMCILFPAFQAPLKDRFPLENKMHRINMLKLLIKNETNTIKIDNWEIRQSDYSYTYKTINYLKKFWKNSGKSRIHLGWNFLGKCFWKILGNFFSEIWLYHFSTFIDP